MTANRILLQHKYANVIAAFAKRQHIGLREAMDVFYKSYTYQDMRVGVSDMHCRSDEYLAEELTLEKNNQT
ncbi:MAG: DUF3791 domain-containing protein [Firmicutes bacterium]|nr:DUF3791 domain-containing protein [Bacillota bacterium]